MKLGLTYDLREDWRSDGFSEQEIAEFDRSDTIDHLEHAARAFGFEVDRVGRARALQSRLATGDRWDLVLNISEGLLGFGRESLVPTLLDGERIPYVFSDPLVCAMTLHKGVTKRFLRDHGIRTPDFAVVRRPEDLAGLELDYPLFAKPVAEGSSKGIFQQSRCRGPHELATTVTDLLQRYRQPVLVETFLPGAEVTVGILGSGDHARCLGVLAVSLKPEADQGIYTYENKERCEELVEYTLADSTATHAAAEIALAAWRALGARDGGRVDLRADAEGRFSFLEANPLPGLHPEHSDLPILAGLVGMPYEKLIGEILESAMRRVRGEEPNSWTC